MDWFLPGQIREEKSVPELEWRGVQAMALEET